ncbi:MAG: BON domain-containing protein [Kofleriaceae bacterium]
MKTDTDLKHDVERELAWDVRIDDSAIGVAVHHGVVTLTGTVGCWADKHAVEEAAYRITGVRDLANEISIKPSWDESVSDSELAESIRQALRWNHGVPHEQLRVTVCDRGAVTLAGKVDALRERDEAERVVRGLAGIKSVTNEIEIAQVSLSSTKLRETIVQALARHAAHAANHIDVGIDGDTIVLRGKVSSWAERRAAVGAARGTAGVTRVDDQLFIG